MVIGPFYGSYGFSGGIYSPSLLGETALWELAHISKKRDW
jgi:hypothetical protein